uniref:Retrovirus-related Pol polyprotein from transposon TNT 1-94 n=1 Tax=Cajanus cajan TaxID=3821 RepID=A0A151T1Q0_CAJCA|nr:hypothetical protein KK1_023397 [Cajanus cajan]
MWDVIRITHESTKDVKLKCFATLQRHYELFSMNESESMDEMFGIFQTILNGLKSLGIEFF